MSTEPDITRIIAKNIADLRKSKGMTQAGLAELLGYSDKSISKWERAEGLPDVLCMKRIADLFGVPVDWFFCEEHSTAANDPQPADSVEDSANSAVRYVTSRRSITLLSIAGTWMLAAVVYVILVLCKTASFMPFVIALPITALLTVIFHGMWGCRKKFRRGIFLSVTFLVWSILFLICWLCRAHDLWLLMTLGFPATIVVALACSVKKKLPPDDAE